MIFELSEPYASRFGKELVINLLAPLELRALIGSWPDELLPPGVLGPTGLAEDRLLAYFLFFRDGRRIGLGEAVFDSDVINVMLTATGG
jgi:hypothetical protein